MRSKSCQHSNIKIKIIFFVTGPSSRKTEGKKQQAFVPLSWTTVLPIREEISSPSEFWYPWAIISRKRKRKKKESAEFSPFSLNAVGDSFLTAHVRTKGLLLKHFLFLSMLTSRFLAALSSGQGIWRGKKW